MTKLMEKLAALPRELDTQNRRIYIVPESEEAKAIALDFIARAKAARGAAWTFAKKHGADGVYEASPSFGGQPTALVFKEKPANGLWRAMSRHSGKGWGGYPSKAGHAIKEEMEALPPLPAGHELKEPVGLLGAIKATSAAHDKEYGRIGLNGLTIEPGMEGRDGGLYFTVYGFLEPDRLFVVAPNPFFDIAQHAERWPDLEVPDEVLDWRPAAGWKLTTKAQVDLAYAENNAKKEAERTAA